MAHSKRKRHQHEHEDEALDTPKEKRSATIVAMPMPASQQSDPHHEPPFERIGDILRNERERRGDDLQQIADHLCIRRGFLNAIENSNYDEFPADIYVVGFLRSYAQYLNLDGQEVVDYYRHEMEGRCKKPALVLPVPISEGRTPSAFILIGAAVLALLIYGAWYSFSTSDRTAVSAPPALPPAASSDTSALIHGNEKAFLPVSPPANTDGTPAASLPPTVVIPAASKPVPTPPAAVQAPDTASATPPAAPPAPAQASTPAPAPETASGTPVNTTPESILPQAASAQTAEPVKPDATPPAAAAEQAPAPKPHLLIKADQTSWVLITDSKGHSVYDNVMRAGDAYVVPDTPGLTMTTGNGAGLVLILDGKSLPKISKSSSRIIHNVPLNAAALKNISKFE